MILKHHSLNENIVKVNNIFLLYGNNEGLKNETIDKIVKDNQVYKYDENGKQIPGSGLKGSAL